MFKIIKKIVYFIIFYSKLIKVFELVYQKKLNFPARVFFTHRIIEEKEDLFQFLRRKDYLTLREFEKKIKFLKRFYNPIPLDDFYNNLLNKNFSSKRIVLTFDDGYKCIYTHNFPFTVFISTGYIGTKRILSHDKLTFLIGKTKCHSLLIPELSNKIYSLFSLNDKLRTYNELNSALKTVNNDKREKIIEDMFVKLKLSYEDLENEGIMMLSWEEINEMLSSGLMTIASHTVNHPILTKIPFEIAKKEINESKREIEEKLGISVKYFSYPNGQLNDFNEEIIQFVKAIGYLAAFTTINKVNNTAEEIFKIGRFGLSNDPIYLFGISVSGLRELFK